MATIGGELKQIHNTLLKVCVQLKRLNSASENHSIGAGGGNSVVSAEHVAQLMPHYPDLQDGKMNMSNCKDKKSVEYRVVRKWCKILADNYLSEFQSHGEIDRKAYSNKASVLALLLLEVLRSFGYKDLVLDLPQQQVIVLLKDCSKSSRHRHGGRSPSPTSRDGNDYDDDDVLPEYDGNDADESLHFATTPGFDSPGFGLFDDGDGVFESSSRLHTANRRADDHSDEDEVDEVYDVYEGSTTQEQRWARAQPKWMW